MFHHQNHINNLISFDDDETLNKLGEIVLQKNAWGGNYNIIGINEFPKIRNIRKIKEGILSCQTRMPKVRNEATPR